MIASATASGVSQIDIADITFDVIGGPGDSTTLTFSEVKAFDDLIPPAPISVTPADGSINITCTLVVDVTFADGITTWSFVVGATEPSTWSTSVILLGNDIPLWSIALPALPPITISFSFPIPPIGVVEVLSTLAVEGGECTDSDAVDTG